MTAEDTLLNALEDAGLIHPDWEGIDHQDLPKDMRDAVTKAIRDAKEKCLTAEFD